MSTKEKAIALLDLMTEEQLQGLLSFIRGFYKNDVPNAETVEAMLEADEIARDPNVKGYTNMADLMEALNEE